MLKLTTLAVLFLGFAAAPLYAPPPARLVSAAQAAPAAPAPAPGQAPAPAPAAKDGHAAHPKGGMPQLKIPDFPPQLIWLALTFIALYIIMARAALPRIASVLDERREHIASDLDRAGQFKEQTEQAIAAYEQALAEARGKAHGIAHEARDTLNGELNRERAAIEKQIASKSAEAEKRITSAKESALSHVSEIAGDTAEAVVEHLIGEKVSKSELASAVGGVLQK